MSNISNVGKHRMAKYYILSSCLVQTNLLIGFSSSSAKANNNKKYRGKYGREHNSPSQVTEIAGGITWRGKKIINLTTNKCTRVSLQFIIFFFFLTRQIDLQYHINFHQILTPYTPLVLSSPTYLLLFNHRCKLACIRQPTITISFIIQRKGTVIHPAPLYFLPYFCSCESFSSTYHNNYPPGVG